MGRISLRQVNILSLFNDHWHCRSEDSFKLSCDLARPSVQRLTQLYWWEQLKVSHHPANIRIHRYCFIINDFGLSHNLARPRDQKAM